MDDGGMVFSAEALTYIGKAGAGEGLGKVHGNLSGKGDGSRVVTCPEVGGVEVVMIGHELLDHVRVDDALLAGQEVTKNFLSQGEVNRTAG